MDVWDIKGTGWLLYNGVRIWGHRTEDSQALSHRMSFVTHVVQSPPLHVRKPL